MSLIERSVVPIICGLAVVVSAGTAAGFQSAANSTCETAETTTGEGLFSFDNTGPVTADRPRSDGCGIHAYPEFLNDLWYCWTAPCAGDVTVDTCGTTTVDTKLEIWAGCDCNSRVVLACNDNAECGMQARVSFSAVSGEHYLIRLATSSADFISGGTGQFTVRCAAPLPAPCARSSATCRLPDPWNALTSDRTEFVAAARLTPAESGLLTQLCWWGLYFDGKGDCSAGASDAFEVRYYADAAGVPGELLAGPFQQTAGSLAVTGPARTNRFAGGLAHEFEYSATHDPVEVTKDTCYWVEVTDTLAPPCAWMWQGAYPSAGRAIQDGAVGFAPDGYDLLDAVAEDLAFCTNLALNATPSCQPPANDACEDAAAIFDGPTIFSTIGATTDGPTESQYYSPGRVYAYLPFGDNQIHQDIWFEYQAKCAGVLSVDVCDSNFDTKLAMYSTTFCKILGSLYPNAVRYNDDYCGDDSPWQSYVSQTVMKGQTYKIRVGGFRGQSGTGVISVSFCPPPRTECSDDCSRPGDLNCDGIIAVADYPAFSACLNGPCVEWPDYPGLCLADSCTEFSCEPFVPDEGCCALADIDLDGDRDLRDFAQLQSNFDR